MRRERNQKNTDKTIRKEHLPTKICPVCMRPFAWRKKWAKNWENVRYCSDGCRKNAPPQETKNE
jgi:hypothetical protein